MQAHAMAAWESDGDFQGAISSDPAVTRYLDPQKLAEAFSTSHVNSRTSKSSSVGYFEKK